MKNASISLLVAVFFATNVLGVDGEYDNLKVNDRQGIGISWSSNYRLYVSRPSTETGAGKTTIYGYRPGTSGEANGGTSFSQSGVDAAVKGYSYYGNNYSAGVAGYNYMDYPLSAGVVGAKQNGSYAGMLGYRDGNGDYWSGFFEDQVRFEKSIHTQGMINTNQLGDRKWIYHSWNEWLTLCPDGSGLEDPWRYTNGITMHSNGKVAIGDNFNAGTHDQRLFVDGDIGANGTVVCRELNVTTQNWPDYVFKPEYKLKPLNEVEEYVKKHSRLPNIPSEEEVKKNGVAVGQMQAKLLEKVEEMTLYMIELKKENVVLSSRIAELEKR